MVKAKEPKLKYAIDVIVTYNIGNFTHMMNFDRSTNSIDDMEAFGEAYKKIMYILTELDGRSQPDVPDGTSTD